jgi:hypothetical protein
MMNKMFGRSSAAPASIVACADSTAIVQQTIPSLRIAMISGTMMEASTRCCKLARHLIAILAAGELN